MSTLRSWQATEWPDLYSIRKTEEIFIVLLSMMKWFALTGMLTMLLSDKFSKALNGLTRKKVDQEWELISDGQVLTFIVDGMQILKVRYMPLEYSGFGFYTFGKQELAVDDVEFIQM